MREASLAGPFLKWAGGKAKLAPTILERAPAHRGRYHEPFLGAGAVFFAFAAAGRAVGARLSDSNAALVECFAVVRDDPGLLIERLELLEAEYLALTAEGRAARYYEERAARHDEPVARAARLIFLNRTCYNGLFRVNSRGDFNVPHGRYARPRIASPGVIRAASKALEGAGISRRDFAGACDLAEPGDFVYLDPPYQPLSATARFTSYTSEDFGPQQQERLRDAFEELTRRGVAAVLSNSSHPFVESLYAGRGYTRSEVTMSRAINRNGGGRAPVPELLIDNLGRPEVRAALATVAAGS